MTARDDKLLDIRTRQAWRAWLDKRHAAETAVWLVFHKRHTGVECLSYEDAVEEALCYGWVDSLIKRLDADRYARKFTPRSPGSRWSAINRKRYASLEKRGLLARPGLARAPTGHGYEAREMPVELPEEFARRLARNRRAEAFFESLAPSYRAMFIGWVASAKREETRKRRLDEAMALLAAGKKLGMK